MLELRAVKPRSHGNEVQAWICRWLSRVVRHLKLLCAANPNSVASRLAFSL